MEKTEDSETCQLSNKPNWSLVVSFFSFLHFEKLKREKKISGCIMYLYKVTPNCLHSTACSFNIFTVGKNNFTALKLAGKMAEGITTQQL